MMANIIGVGIDATEVDRIAAAIEKYGDRFLRRVFTDGEIAYCMRHRVPSINFGARFAAKEAAMKALGTGHTQGVLWRDIEVVRRGGPPQLGFHGGAGRRSCACSRDDPRRIAAASASPRPSFVSAALQLPLSFSAGFLHPRAALRQNTRLRRAFAERCGDTTALFPAALLLMKCRRLPRSARLGALGASARQVADADASERTKQERAA
jgi:holo-[acyl-carrier protein] synthase